jgi:hypothetical protein
LFIKTITRESGPAKLLTFIHTFLESFQARRQKNLLLDEDTTDPLLIEFGRLMQQGTNDLQSLKTRFSILKRYFLLNFLALKSLGNVYLQHEEALKNIKCTLLEHNLN